MKKGGEKMGIKLIKMSVIYFAIGVLLGYYMSISHSHDLAPVHAHINLLGWTALTLAGIIYHIFPDLSRNKLGIGHFWLHSFGLPVMMGSLFALITTNKTMLGC
jgi:cbb3-type cytochrome oxidase subunit 1